MRLSYSGAMVGPMKTNRTWLATTLAIVVVLTALALRYQRAWALVIGAAILIPLERRFRRHDYAVLRPGVRTDVYHFLFTQILEIGCLLAGAGAAYVLLRPYAIEPAVAAVASLPFVATALLTLLLFQVGFYWQHRLSHEVGFLWRFHSVHHSSERLDWLAATHLHPVEGFVAGLVIGPAFVLLDLQPATIALLSAVESLWAVVNHANVNGRLRWMDRVWQNPEYHHWHHSNEPDARNHNYGLPILDTLFGTYFMPDSRRPAEYGIEAAMPEGYLAQLASPF